MEMDPRFERWFTPVILVIGNLIPLAGVVVWDWDVGSIVMLYWAENLVLGALTIFKMFVTQPVGALFMAAFFLVHYGGFCAVHGLIAGSLFGLPIDDAMDNLNWPFVFVFVEMLYTVVREVFSNAPDAWMFAVVSIGVSHTISMIVHFFIRGERHATDLNKLMFAPYKRIVVLHIAILAGGGLVMALSSPLPLLLILIALKIGLDIRLHMQSHSLGEQTRVAAQS